MPIIFFHFLKIIFDISTSKQSKKYKPHSILTQKKLKFSQMQVQSQSQTGSKSIMPGLERWDLLSRSNGAPLTIICPQNSSACHINSIIPNSKLKV